MKFKIGDRVKIVDTRFFTGMIGTIVEIRDNERPYNVQFDDTAKHGTGVYAKEEALEFLEA